MRGKLARYVKVYSRARPVGTGSLTQLGIFIRRCLTRSPRRHDRQEKPRLPLGVDVQRLGSAKNVGRTIARLVMGEWADATQRIRHMRRDDRSATILVVFAANRQCYGITRWHRDAGRP